jgi:hypothetical protein
LSKGVARDFSTFFLVQVPFEDLDLACVRVGMELSCERR